MRSPWRILRALVEDRARRWARRRQGLDPPALTLESRRVYIFPTAAGWLYAIMLATMLAGAMNYNNNLAFALTFLLAAAGIVSIFHTHRTLCGIHLQYLGGQSVFAGDPISLQFRLTNESLRAREEIFLDWCGCPPVAGGLDRLDRRTVSLDLLTMRRGPLGLPALRISTRTPLGLMQAWAWIHADSRPLIYPRPSARAPQARSGQVTAPEGSAQRSDENFYGLRDYQQGDPARHIAWKSYARSGELLVRDYRDDLRREPLWIDWDALPASDVETRIARLTRLVITAFEEDREWGLMLPDNRIGPGHGKEHLHHCLRCLATTALPEELS